LLGGQGRKRGDNGECEDGTHQVEPFAI